MKFCSWLLICLKLLLLVTVLNARRCVKPNPTTTTTTVPPVTDKPTLGPLTTLTAEPEPEPEPITALPTEPTDEPSTELPIESSTEPARSTTAHAVSSPADPTTEGPEELTTTVGPVIPTTEIITPTSGPTTTTTEIIIPTTEIVTPTSGPTTTTTEIPIDPNQMCKNHPGVKYLPHPYNCHKYILCDDTTGEIQECSGDLLWDSRTNTCGTTCA